MTSRCNGCGALCEVIREAGGANHLHQEGARHTCIPRGMTATIGGRILYGGPLGTIVLRILAEPARAAA